MIPAEAPVCEADDELHVRHDVGSKQLAVHPGTAGLDTRPQAKVSLAKGGGEGERGEGGGEGELGGGGAKVSLARRGAKVSLARGGAKVSLARVRNTLQDLVGRTQRLLQSMSLQRRTRPMNSNAAFQCNLNTRTPGLDHYHSNFHMLGVRWCLSRNKREGKNQDPNPVSLESRLCGDQ